MVIALGATISLTTANFFMELSFWQKPIRCHFRSTLGVILLYFTLTPPRSWLLTLPHSLTVSDQMYIFLTETLPFKIESNGRFYEVTREKSNYMMLNFEQNTSFAIKIVLRTRQQTFTFLHRQETISLSTPMNPPATKLTNSKLFSSQCRG